VFALQLENGNKSGYIPAYRYEPYRYRLHKDSGGTFQSYIHKTYQPLSEIEINMHLREPHLIGIYPLLEDKTSRFFIS